MLHIVNNFGGHHRHYWTGAYWTMFKSYAAKYNDEKVARRIAVSLNFLEDGHSYIVPAT